MLGPFTPLEAMITPLPTDTTLLTHTQKKHALYLNELQTKLQLAHDYAKKRHQAAASAIDAQNAELDPAKVITFKVGDLVLIREPTMKKGISGKLYRPWKGPYLITESYGNKLNYQVQKMRKDGKVSTQGKLKVVNIKFMKAYTSPSASDLRVEMERKEKELQEQLRNMQDNVSEMTITPPPNSAVNVPLQVEQQVIDVQRGNSDSMDSDIPSSDEITPDGRRRSSRKNKGMRHIGVQWIDSGLIRVGK